jgi:UDP-N-acetylmuramate--alanine ligase
MKKAYFIGIGGIGVSAMARKYLLEGWQVSGSDRSSSHVTAELEKLGVKVNYVQVTENITAALDLVIYTIALPNDQPELVRARELGLKPQSYPEALGELTRSHYTVAVSGTHGKTTTTAMIAKIAVDAGLDPTVVVGSFLIDQQSNFVAGKSKLLIVEACEYRRSFLNLHPQIIVITNIDNDHLDYYKDLDDIKLAFKEFAGKLPADGKLVTEAEYSQMPSDFKLKVPGTHNIRNAQAALAVADILGVPREQAIKSLEGFSGTWRRFEYKGNLPSGAKVYDDYAHHPTEIKATLHGAREVTKGKLWAIFQPHLYSRTKLLFSDFVESLSLADEVIVTDIYAAREVRDENVGGDKLAQAITSNHARYIADFDAIASTLKEETGPDDLVLIMGAGNISDLPQHLL